MEAMSPLTHVKVDVVQLQRRGWTQNGAAAYKQKQSVAQWTLSSLQLQSTNIIYKSPPQRSINFVLFMSCIFVYYSFFKPALFVYIIFCFCFLFFQRREQCWRGDGIRILCPKSAIIKFLELLLCRVNIHSFSTFEKIIQVEIVPLSLQKYHVLINLVWLSDCYR